MFIAPLRDDNNENNFYICVYRIKDVIENNIDFTRVRVPIGK